MDRRQFLKHSLATLLATSIYGCTPNSNPTPPNTTSTITASLINFPQNAHEKDYTLFEFKQEMKETWPSAPDYDYKEWELLYRVYTEKSENQEFGLEINNKDIKYYTRNMPWINTEKLTKRDKKLISIIHNVSEIFKFR